MVTIRHQESTTASWLKTGLCDKSGLSMKSVDLENDVAKAIVGWYTWNDDMRAAWADVYHDGHTSTCSTLYYITEAEIHKLVQADKHYNNRITSKPQDRCGIPEKRWWLPIKECQNSFYHSIRYRSLASDKTCIRIDSYQVRCVENREIKLEFEAVRKQIKYLLPE